MNTPSASSATAWLILAIVGGFLVAFPVIWCGVLWVLSHVSGWHRLAARFACGERPRTDARQALITGMVGPVSYRGTLRLNSDSDGFSLEVMPLFRFGHPPLFIPWSEISGRVPRQMLWRKSVSLRVGHPAIATITLPTALVERHAPD